MILLEDFATASVVVNYDGAMSGHNMNMDHLPLWSSDLEVFKDHDGTEEAYMFYETTLDDLGLIQSIGADVAKHPDDTYELRDIYLQEYSIAGTGLPKSGENSSADFYVRKICYIGGTVGLGTSTQDGSGDLVFAAKNKNGDASVEISFHRKAAEVNEEEVVVGESA